MKNIFEPRISVIIATYNRAHIIGHCLQSLLGQTASQDDFEVIVIDNNSTDNTHEVVNSFKNTITNLVYIEENKQGAGHARNTGLAIARGEWIACLDSDAKAHDDWIEVILREINKNNFDAFGGPYLAWHHFGPPPQWFSLTWETSITAFNYYGEVPSDKDVPTSGNGVFKKSITDTIGGFPTHIGMTGDKCAYGEETKLFEDMRSAGFRLGSVPDLVVDHCVLPYKYTLTWRIKSAYAHGFSAPYLDASYLKLSRLPRRLAAIVKSIIYIPYHILQGIKKKHYWQRIFLDSVSNLFVSCGILHACSKILIMNLLHKNEKS